MAERNVSIRLSVKEGETVRRALMALGDDGQRALARIEKQSRPASRGLLAVNAASGELRANMVGLGSRLGLAGTALMALGPAGLAASAAAAIASVTLVGLTRSAKNAVVELQQLGDTASKLDVGVEALQEWRYAFEQTGVSSQTLEMALQRLGRRVGEIANFGKGEAKNALDQMGISVLNAAGRVKSLEELLPEVADGLARVADQGRRLSLAQKLFDSEGVAMVTLLQQGSAEMARMRSEARELGAVIDAHLVARASETAIQLASLQRVIDSKINSALVDLAPLLTDVAEAFAAVARGVADVVDGLRDIEDRSTRGLERRLEVLSEKLAGGRQAQIGRQVLSGDQAAFMTPTEDYDALFAERERVMAELMAREHDRRAAERGRATAADAQTADAEAEKVRKVIQALRFQEEQLGRTAREQAIHNELQRAGVTLDSEAGRTIAELTGRYWDATDGLKAVNDVERALLDAQYEQTVRRGEIADGIDAEIEGNERLIAALRVSETEYERVKSQIELINRYRQAGIDMSPDDIAAIEAASRKLGEQRAELDRLKDSAESARRLGADVGMTFSSAFEDAVLSARSLGEAVRALGLDLARIALRQAVTAPMTGMFSNWFAGMWGGGMAAVKHEGGPAGAPGPRRRVSPLAFVGAPRLHDGWPGLRPGELPAILLERERVLTVAQQDSTARSLEALARLAAAGGGAAGAGGVIVQAPVSVTVQGGMAGGRMDPAALEALGRAIEEKANAALAAAAERQMRPGGLLNRQRML